MALSLGGLGIWYLYDVIVVAAGGFRDVEGRLVASWEVDEPMHADLTQDVLQELHHLRSEVAELTERVDFTERLLAEAKRSPLDVPREEREHR